MAVNGSAAANWLRSQKRLAHFGACLHYVWQAYKAQGASTGHSARTALQAWNLSDGKHHGDRNPPAGVPVWFGAKPSSAAGDVVISLGGGKVVCTDYPTYGRVGVCTIAQRQAQIGRPYLGWTERIFDQPIALPSTVEVTKPTPTKPAPPKPIPAPDPEPILEEDDMPQVNKHETKAEWMLIDPDVGTDLDRLGSGSGGRATIRTEQTAKGVVNTYRGFLVTTDPYIGAAWGRSYCRPYGNAPLTRKDADWRLAQSEAARLSVEKHRS